MAVALIGTVSFIGSWLAGGYYYVKSYGPLVKPTIVSGSAPWAHSIAMEAKEHIFLFIIPIALTILFVSTLDTSALKTLRLKKSVIALLCVTVAIGFTLGLMGYIISAAARWAVI